MAGVIEAPLIITLSMCDKLLNLICLIDIFVNDKL